MRGCLKLNIIQKLGKNYNVNIPNDNILYGEAQDGMVPIYVILTSGTSIISKAIMNVTRSKYSHCTLALNHYETISMGTTSKNFGIAVESILEFPDRHRDGNIKICRRFVPISIFERMSYRVEKYKKNWKKLGYDFSKMRNFFKWIPKTKVSSYRNETSFICSEFVALILSTIGDFEKRISKDNLKNERGSKYMLSPKDIENAIMSTFDVIYEGTIYGIPMTFLYDIDKKYITLKNKVTKDVLQKLNKSGNINMKSKMIALSDNSQPSMMNSSLELETMRKYLHEQELQSYQELF